jgi:hypothetical protein
MTELDLHFFHKSFRETNRHPDYGVGADVEIGVISRSDVLDFHS